MKSHGDNYGILTSQPRTHLRYRLARMFNGLKLRDWKTRHEEAKWSTMVTQKRDPMTGDAAPYFMRKWK